MVTELTSDIKTVPSGTWRLCQGRISDQGNLGTKQPVWTGDTREELEAFKLTLPAPKTKAEQAAEYFATSSQTFRDKYGLLFTALHAQTNDGQKLLAIRALTPSTDEETTAKAALIAIFTGT